jgi:hypothetical protein
MLLRHSMSITVTHGSDKTAYVSLIASHALENESDELPHIVQMLTGIHAESLLMKLVKNPLAGLDNVKIVV